jgi:hypothetical protein
MNAVQPVSLEANAHSPAPYLAGQVAVPFVRQSADCLVGLSDEALHRYIHACAEQFLAAQRRWEQTGCFAAVGERDAYWLAEVDALVEMGSQRGSVSSLMVEGAAG